MDSLNQKIVSNKLKIDLKCFTFVSLIISISLLSELDKKGDAEMGGVQVIIERR